MKCPFCGGQNTQVRDSRPSEDHAVIRRRRSCSACGARFTTFERVQLRELTVVKRNGQRVPFDRDKLLTSVRVALRKRPVRDEWIEERVSALVRQFETRGDSDISSEDIGRKVMEALKEKDPVGYVRFASVYRDFDQAEDFEDILTELAQGVAVPKDRSR